MTASLETGARPWPGALDWGGDWVADAAGELANLGFVLRDGGRPGSIPGPRLLVAFRSAPTLAHFDPEEATFWEGHAGRGRVARVDRAVGTPLSRPFSWGRIRVTDRVPVTNHFLTFGGTLLGAARDDRETLVAFTSRAPIVRWAGHSQGVDPLADEVGSFFARLRVPLDYQAGAEERILDAGPEPLYSAFIDHALLRLGPHGRLREADPTLARQIDRERSRLCRESPGSVREGAELLAWLELD